MKRILIIVLLTVLFLGIAGGGGSYSLALNAPYSPGDTLYGVQLASEQLWALSFNSNPVDRANVLLELLSRRLDDLFIVVGTSNEPVALTAVDNAYLQALQAIADAPTDKQPALIADLSTMAARGQAILASMSPNDETAVQITALNGKFGRFLQVAGTDSPDLASLAAELTNQAAFAAELALTPSPEAVSLLPDALSDPRAVPFPPNADIGAAHNFFPLTGGHDNIACTDCHTGTTYRGTDNRCVACHLKDDVHQGANGPDCATCHSITKWQDVSFDHSTIGDRDCAECHEPPPNHFEGACRNCHTDTTNFKNAFFDHSTIGNQDCSACHNPPANHYQGACRNCHFDTTNFKNAIFDHSTIGNQDCSACHNPPANHYQGACRNCHFDTTNFKNAIFDHSTIGNQDCSACHNPPANHYQGACRNCHFDTMNFKNAFFDHSGIGNQDCSGCHNPPANHYPGACRNCHGDTSNFRNVNFSHAGLTDCASCHQPPPNHFSGQCSQCHNTSTFSGATFNHTFPMNHGDANGDCARCHTNGGNGPASCFLCHDQQKIEKKHRDEGISDFSNCMACHANGKENGGGDGGGGGHDDDD
ncbi:MAG: hypothetical protein Kow0080_07250 [Candidatus Promineifilaceae bacterium]